MSYVICVNIEYVSVEWCALMRTMSPIHNSIYIIILASGSYFMRFLLVLHYMCSKFWNGVYVRLAPQTTTRDMNPLLWKEALTEKYTLFAICTHFCFNLFILALDLSTSWLFCICKCNLLRALFLHFPFLLNYSECQ